MKMKTAFIGGGIMGDAILAAVLREKLSTPESVCVSDVSAERREYLAKQYGVAVTENNREAVSNKDIVILAIKPQNLPEVVADLKGCLGPAQLVLSIIAGASIKSLSQGLGDNCIVRIMPNTPARIGKGMTVWTTTEDVSEQQRELTGSILGVMGREIAVDNEDQIDMATAVSGSGPAYLFLFVELESFYP